MPPWSVTWPSIFVARFTYATLTWCRCMIMGDDHEATEVNRTRQWSEVMHTVSKQSVGEAGMFSSADVLATAITERRSRRLLQSSNMTHQQQDLCSLYRGNQALVEALQQATPTTFGGIHTSELLGILAYYWSAFNDTTVMCRSTCNAKMHTISLAAPKTVYGSKDLLIYR